jgi:A nuclease of the HNH/ENDO VII superfamily with conserved LHH
VGERTTLDEAPGRRLGRPHPGFGVRCCRNTAVLSSRYTRTTFGGNRVYQRDDLINRNFVDDLGRTNLERMQSGIAPIGPDGRSINLHHTCNLHHVAQRPNGAIAIVIFNGVAR